MLASAGRSHVELAREPLSSSIFFLQEVVDDELKIRSFIGAYEWWGRSAVLVGKLRGLLLGASDACADMNI